MARRCSLPRITFKLTFMCAPGAQSASLRLSKDSGSVMSARDAVRNISSTPDQSIRRPFIKECTAASGAASEQTHRPSAQAPWFKALGASKHLNQQISKALTLALSGRDTPVPKKQSGDSFHEVCVNITDRLAERGALELFRDSTAWQPGGEGVDAQVQGCALKEVATRRNVQKQCYTELLPNSSIADLPLFGCPAPRIDGRTLTISGVIGRLHCVARHAGYIDDSASHAKHVIGTFFEAGLVPRPPACALRDNQPRLAPWARQKWPRVSKLVNAKRKLEFRPLMKSGSMYLMALLPCLQPGEWEVVPQNRTMPRGFTALAVVRDPIRRFVAALIEVMRRIFSGQCPEGECSARDFYFTSGRHDSADSLARFSSWYPLALRLYQNGSEAHNRRRAIRDLLAAAVTDTSCSIYYYGADHFMTQSVQMIQGLNSDKLRTFKLEDLGRTSQQLRASKLIEAIGGQGLPLEQLDKCIVEGEAAEHHKSETTTATPRAASEGGFAALPSSPAC